MGVLVVNDPNEPRYEWMQVLERELSEREYV